MIDNTVFTISGDMIENTVFTISGNMIDNTVFTISGDMIENTVFTISGNMVENTVFTISGNMVAGCSNQLQVAQGQVLVRDCSLVQAAVGCFILLLLVTKMVLTLCNLRWSVVYDKNIRDADA